MDFADAPPPQNERREKEEKPKVISDANFIAEYPDGYEPDASNMLAWANQVVNRLQTCFPDFLSVIDSRVIIVIKDTGEPGHDCANVDRPSIKFLAPSVATKSKNYYDNEYYLGNIAHELGHIVFDRYRTNAGGYKRADCPRWFEEGFGEYLKLLVLGEQRFNEKYSWYYTQIPYIMAKGTSGLSDVYPSGAGLSDVYPGGAGLSDVYPGGAWVLRFMNSKFGIDAIKAIIKSKKPTFWAAVNEQINLTPVQFDEQLKEWLKERIKE